MNFHLFVRRVLMSAAWLFAAHGMTAAVITGHVYNADDGIYVESARVTVMETEQQVLTGRGGRFRITGLGAGTYTLMASSTGLPTTYAEALVESDSDEITVNVNITRERVFELEAMVVEGTLLGVARGLDIRRAAREYRDVVSSDAAGQFTDRNPAEALQRVAGVTTEGSQGEGNFLIIRGSAPELSAVQIDGVSLATPEADGRRVNLNVITVDQLERIELSKTWLPSQKGNVIGGTVNLITRSALDRGERFASLEAAATYRQHQKDELSYRGSVTYGDFLDSSVIERLGNQAIGIQFSINQSDDYSGSDTVTWGWNTGKAFPFQEGQGGIRPYGYTLETVNMRNFNIRRERLGASARLEYRFNDNHEIYGSLSYNKFDDTVQEQIFNMQQGNTAQGYVGNRFLTSAIVQQIGLDTNDPEIIRRLALPPSNFSRALTYAEAIAIGDIDYDPETKMFNRGGAWTMPMGRDFVHIFREDRIETYQLGGKHCIPWEIEVKWKVYNTDATQDSEQNRIDFEVGGSALGIALAGPAYRNPFILDPAENPVVTNKASFAVIESVGGTNYRSQNFLQSRDTRSGGDLDLNKRFELGPTTWITQVGYALDKREKSYEVSGRGFSLRRDQLDRSVWPLGRLSLAEPFFEGKEIPGFRKNFGPDLPFGPSFNPVNTLAFMKDPRAFGANDGQNENLVTSSVTDRLQSNYDAGEDIEAFYLQQTMDWGPWSFIAGFRYESTRNTFANLEVLTRNPEFPQIRFIQPSQWNILLNNFGEIFARTVTSERRYDHWLPALHVVREFGDNMQVRASVTKTIARPLFSDLIPREIPDISGNTYQPDITVPAFDLMPMESVNYDISFNYYFEPVGLFSAAVFYKDLDGPIYDEARLGVGPDDETLPYEIRYNPRNANLAPGAPFINDRAYNFRRKRNGGDGKLLGAEFTYDRRLNFLPGVWNGLGINSNISWFESEATLLTERRLDEKVPLFRQPDMTANLALYYEKHGIFARLSYNVRGKYLESVAAGSTLLDNLILIGDSPDSMDTYVTRTSRIDFSMRYRITPSLQVFFEALNLTNEPQVKIRGNALRPASKQYTESIFTLGVKWNL